MKDYPMALTLWSACVSNDKISKSFSFLDTSAWVNYLYIDWKIDVIWNIGVISIINKYLRDCCS